MVPHARGNVVLGGEGLEGCGDLWFKGEGQEIVIEFDESIEIACEY